MSHTPFFFFVLTDKLLSFALWTAFPSSDYYGSSVTMADIQSRLSHGAHSREWAAFRFRQSPFSTIEMSVLYSRMRRSPFSTVPWLGLP